MHRVEDDQMPSSAEFVEQAIARGLLIIPGNIFSQRDTHFRISFAASDETLQRGIELLRELACEGPGRT